MSNSKGIDVGKDQIWGWLSSILNKTIIILCILASIKITEVFAQILWPEGNPFITIILYIGYTFLIYLLISYGLESVKKFPK